MLSQQFLAKVGVRTPSAGKRRKEVYDAIISIPDICGFDISKKKESPVR
jgi:hypothetical protein